MRREVRWVCDQSSSNNFSFKTIAFVSVTNMGTISLTSTALAHRPLHRCFYGPSRIDDRYVTLVFRARVRVSLRVRFLRRLGCGRGDDFRCQRLSLQLHLRSHGSYRTATQSTESDTYQSTQTRRLSNDQ